MTYGPWHTVVMSTFGGPGDPGTGSEGYRGDKLKGRAAFAELSINWQNGPLDYSAMGGLQHGDRVKIRKARHFGNILIGYHTAVIEKLDIGRGGDAGGLGNYRRALDLWYEVCPNLGITPDSLYKIQWRKVPNDTPLTKL